MPRKTNLDAVFQSPRGAAMITGLSKAFILDGCKNGSIPHIMCGGDYRINMPVWLHQLNQESTSIR